MDISGRGMCVHGRSSAHGEATLPVCVRAGLEAAQIWSFLSLQSILHAHYSPRHAIQDGAVTLFLQLLHGDIIMLLSQMLRGLINYVYETL